MTEAELLVVAQGYRDSAIAMNASFLSVVTAYLIVAYTAGKNLNFVQVLTINTFFVVVAVFMIVSQFTLMTYAAEADLAAREISTWKKLPRTGFVPYGIQVFYLLFVFISLKFMWDIRHPKE
jgi:hypothetical protein